MNHDFLATFATWLQQFPGGETAFTTLIFIIVLGILIFVHEFGHYFAARSVGIRVTAFSIGFGKELAGWRDRHGTRWQLGWIPLGGYVQMHGQEDGKPYEESADKDAFGSKSVFARMWVIVAGPFANLLFAFVLLSLVMLTGDHKLKPEIGDVVKDMPAYGQLQKGDLIRLIDGKPIIEWDDMQSYVEAHPGKTVQLVVERAGAAASINLTPTTTTFRDLLGDMHTVGRIGIAPSYATFVVKHAPAAALREGALRTWELIDLTLKSLGKLVIGAISADNLTGPLGIANMAGQTAANGLFAVSMFMAIISVNLGIVNLIPLPILDGGHLLFLAYEGLRGRPLSARIQAAALKVGLVFIVTLAVFATVNDLKRISLFSRLLGATPAVEAKVDTPAASK
ncbi:MAG: RIP metalloprotease RseP [Lentisphaeria bacterium]